MKKGKKSPFVLANSFKVSEEFQDKYETDKKYEIKVLKFDFLQKYKLSSLLKIYNYGVRPKRWINSKLFKIIEEIYDERFKDEMNYIRKTLNIFADDDEKKEPLIFYKYVYEFFLNKCKKNAKLAETKCLNLLASLDVFYQKENHFRLFFNFINNNYNSLDLNCFLLLRFIVQKAMNEKNRKMNLKKQTLFLHNYQIGPKSSEKFLKEMFKECDFIDSRELTNMIFSFDKALEFKKVNAYFFLCFVVERYKKIRELKQFQKTELPEGEQKSEEEDKDNDSEKQSSQQQIKTYLSNKNQKENKINLNKDQENPSEDLDSFIEKEEKIIAEKLHSKLNIPELIREEMKDLVEQFVNSLIDVDFSEETNEKSLIDIKTLILLKLNKIISTLCKDNKNEWFKEMLIEDPNEVQKEYTNNLFYRFKYICAKSITDQDILKDFCKRIFKTPEVNNQISSLLTYIFDKNNNNNDFDSLTDSVLNSDEKIFGTFHQSDSKKNLFFN